MSVWLHYLCDINCDHRKDLRQLLSINNATVDMRHCNYIFMTQMSPRGQQNGTCIGQITLDVSCCNTLCHQGHYMPQHLYCCHPSRPQSILDYSSFLHLPWLALFQKCSSVPEQRPWLQCCIRETHQVSVMVSEQLRMSQKPIDIPSFILSFI